MTARPKARRAVDAFDTGALLEATSTIMFFAADKLGQFAGYDKRLINRAGYITRDALAVASLACEIKATVDRSTKAKGKR